jgi:uncharacterized integral membrane protein
MVPTQESPRRNATAAVVHDGDAEPRSQRLRRHGRRHGPFLRAGVAVALVGVLIALVVANTHRVRVDWVVGTTVSPLVWIVFFSAVIGGIVGVIGSALVRRRTRRPAFRAAPSPERGEAAR